MRFSLHYNPQITEEQKKNIMKLKRNILEITDLETHVKYKTLCNKAKTLYKLNSIIFKSCIRRKIELLSAQI